MQCSYKLGNKMSFSLYANMAGFCSDGHIVFKLQKISTINRMQAGAVNYKTNLNNFTN